MKKIAFFTGNRAEYGLIKPLISAVRDADVLDCGLIVSGAHLDEKHGATVAEIRQENFKIFGKFFVPDDVSTPLSTTKAIGSTICGLSDILTDVRPDLFVVYADRYEGFAAVVASSQMGIATCHIEGGDITEGGALDDNLRHAMTKLSHLHFATNRESYHRILALGEEPWRVHDIGYPATDLINEANYTDELILKKEFSLSRSQPIILFTQHSIATETDKVKQQINASVQALQFLHNQGMKIICTYPNTDAGCKEIIAALEKLRMKSHGKIHLVPSLGQARYHGILGLSRVGYKVVCMGNTSSGIKETPAFPCPAVNIGSRQNGRTHATNVISVDYNYKDIIDAVNFVLIDENFISKLKNLRNPYGNGASGKKFLKIVKEVKVDSRLIRKRHIF